MFPGDVPAANTTTKTAAVDEGGAEAASGGEAEDDDSIVAGLGLLEVRARSITKSEWVRCVDSINLDFNARVHPMGCTCGDADGGRQQHGHP